MNDSILCYEEMYQKRCKELKKIGLALDELNNYSNFKDLMSEEVFKKLIRDKRARQKKRSRTKKRFLEIYLLKNCLKCKSNIVFGTITFKNETLDLKEDTYTRKINKWLKSHFYYTILNKDFGKKTERPHFHFIGLTREALELRLDPLGQPRRSKKGYYMYELKNKDFSLGFEPTLNIIDLEKDTIDKTVSYLLKLNNHSNKKTTNKTRVRIIKSTSMKLVELRK